MLPTRRNQMANNYRTRSCRNGMTGCVVMTPPVSGTMIQRGGKRVIRKIGCTSSGEHARRMSFNVNPRKNRSLRYLRYEPQLKGAENRLRHTTY